MKTKLTESAISDLVVPTGKTEMLVWDSTVPGLAMRVGKTRKGWAFVYRPRGAGRTAAPQKIGLGQWPAVSLKAARDAAQIEGGRIARGEDPAAANREAKRKEISSLHKMIELYGASLQARKYVKYVDVISVLTRGLAPYLKRDVATITRHDIVKVIEKIESELKLGAAQDLRVHSRTFFEWTTNRGTTPFNVLAGLRRPRATRAEKVEKDDEEGRALSDDEVRELWLATDPKRSFDQYIRALILCGARRQEFSRLHRDMVLADRLKLPPLHTKQGRPHEIPIVPALDEILMSAPVVPSRLVFPSRRTGREIKGFTKLVQALRDKSGVDFSLHDLRRTFRTGLSRLLFDDDLGEIMLGHQRAELLRLYNKDLRWDERVEAASAWADHVMKVVRGEKVVLPTARARAAPKGSA